MPDDISQESQPTPEVIQDAIKTKLEQTNLDFPIDKNKLFDEFGRQVKVSILKAVHLGANPIELGRSLTAIRVLISPTDMGQLDIRRDMEGEYALFMATVGKVDFARGIIESMSIKPNELIDEELWDMLLNDFIIPNQERAKRIFNLIISSRFGLDDKLFDIDVEIYDDDNSAADIITQLEAEEDKQKIVRLMWDLHVHLMISATS